VFHAEGAEDRESAEERFVSRSSSASSPSSAPSA